MNIKRNVLTLLAGSLLVAALPASAGGLAGSLGGMASGALGGSFGGGLNGAGSLTGGGRFDDAGTFGSLHDHAQQVGGRTRDTVGNVAAAGKSRAESAQAAGAATARATKSAAKSTATSTANQDAPQAQARPDGLLLEGQGAGAVDKQVLGRDVAAQGAGGTRTRADRSGIATDADSDGSVAVTRSPPAAPAETAPAK
jgi:hypothetical protein